MGEHPQEVRKLLAFRVRRIRAERKYSQEMLAQLSDLNRSYIGAVERAEHNIGIDNIVKIANGLSIPTACLFDQKETDTSVEETTDETEREALKVCTDQFLMLIKQCAYDRPDLLVIYLQRCGVRFTG